MQQLEYRKVQIVKISKEAAGQRIDNYLLHILKKFPRNRIYRMLRKGEVRINSSRVKPKRRLVTGDRIRIPPLTIVKQKNNKKINEKQKLAIESRIIHENKEFIILNKPPRLAVHGGSGIALGAIEQLRLSRPKERNLELVHRLDRDTSGLLLIARRRVALKALHKLQREKKIKKRYLALLQGSWNTCNIKCSAPLRKSVNLKNNKHIVYVTQGGKSAVTYFRIIRRFQDLMLVEAFLETGRTHQIRVHAQYLGTPILGDRYYGEKYKQAKYHILKRLFLHAWQLEFPWGKNQTWLKFEAPLEKDLKELLETLSVNLKL